VNQDEEDEVVIGKIIASTISGIIGALASAVMSVLLAAFVLPMPIDRIHHVVGYGIGGFWCGLLSGFLGVFMYIRRLEKMGVAVPARLPAAGAPSLSGSSTVDPKN
jgi:ABC-type transport system involved in multi-copper enzyme maturation permease subunit